MKKVFLALIVLILAPTAIQAQDEVRTRFGIKVAPNLSWTRADSRGLQSEGNRLGYSIGLLAEFPVGISGNYRFASGLYLTTIGGNSSYSYETTDTINRPVTNVQESTWRLRYVEIPLTIKMMTNEIGYLRYYGQLGVSLGANLRARMDSEYRYSVGGVTPPSVIEEDLDAQGDVTTIRAALVIGGGVEYNFSGQTSLLVGLTYNNSILNMVNRDALPGFDSPKLFADYLELTLGIFF